MIKYEKNRCEKHCSSLAISKNYIFHIIVKMKVLKELLLIGQTPRKMNGHLNLQR